MTRAPLTIFVAGLAIVVAGACAKAGRPALQPSAPIPGAIMWQEPTDLASRDLFYGPWGRENAPESADTFTLIEYKRSGVSLGMTVKDGQDREWSVKLPYPGDMDSEAPVEVTVSRLLSAIGYPQPPVYFLPAFKLKDDLGTRTMAGGRFRLKHDTLKEEGSWRWEDNPFIGTRPYQGLLVILMMLNSTDLKNSNNTLYRHRTGDLVEQWYAVRDLGAALGDDHRLAPRKNHVDAFETTAFVTGVSNGHVTFANRGWYQDLVRERITPADVEWAANLLGQLSEQQWNDAFRAGGYEPEIAARFINRLRDKVKEGRALGATLANHGTNKR